MWVIVLLFSHVNFQSVSFLAHFQQKCMMFISEHSLGGWLIDRLTYFIPGDFILIKHWCVLIYLRFCTVCCNAWGRLNLSVSGFHQAFHYGNILNLIFSVHVFTSHSYSFVIFESVTPVQCTDGSFLRSLQKNKHKIW